MKSNTPFNPKPYVPSFITEKLAKMISSDVMSSLALALLLEYSSVPYPYLIISPKSDNLESICPLIFKPGTNSFASYKIPP